MHQTRMERMASEFDPYAILELPRTATAQEIRQQYMKLALKVCVCVCV